MIVKGNIIEGRQFLDNILNKAYAISKQLSDLYSIKPKVCLILVGDNYASHLYIKNKIKAAKKADIIAEKIHLPSDVSEEYLLNLVAQYNADISTHAIIVQMPLPLHINTKKVVNAIDASKDVDGCALSAHFQN